VITYAAGRRITFDTVRHFQLFHKFAQFDLPDHIYNWLVNFFNNHSHCTVFHEQKSLQLDITASIIQGSAIGPNPFVVTAGDLTPAVSGNSLCKFADDTYLIIPASNESSRNIELSNIQNWAKRNNLNLNSDKSSEILFADSNRRRRHVDEPSLLPGIVRCRSLKMLGVIIGDNFSVTQHVQRLVASSAQTHYALRVLHCHGLNTAALQHVYRATVVAHLTYATSTWHGFTKASERQRIDRVMDCARRLGYYPPDAPTFGDLCNTADDKLFSKARLW